MNYTFGLLSADNTVHSAANNAQLLGANTLGIEVTQTLLARRCGLGNIDPQHGAQTNAASSAIEECLTCALPPKGSVIVTLRPDKDAFGAIAVLELRCAGKDKKIDQWLVRWIGALDRMPYRDARVQYPALDEACQQFLIDAMNYIVHSREYELSQKISLLGQILTRELSDTELQRLANRREQLEQETFRVDMFGRVAFINAPGRYRSAREYGNRNFPVVVIFDPEHHPDGSESHQRWCVVRQSRPLVFDRKGFLEEINLWEAKTRGISLEVLHDQSYAWGGPNNMVVSAQGVGYGTCLRKELILDLVRKHQDSGRVT